MNVRRGKEGRKGFVISRGREGGKPEKGKEENGIGGQRKVKEEEEESHNRSVKWILCGPDDLQRGGHFSQSNITISVPFRNLPS